MNTKKPEVIEAPTEEETLVEAIRSISKGMGKLTRSGMNKKAVIVLLQHASGVAQRDIVNVLDNLEDLARKYTRA